MSSAIRPSRYEARAFTVGRPLSPSSPRAALTVWGSRLASESGASSMNQIPSEKRSIRRAATSIASRLFPHPPGPVRVRRRVLSSSVVTSAISRSRPMKVVSCTGRLLGLELRDLRGGNSDGTSVRTIW